MGVGGRGPRRRGSDGVRPPAWVPARPLAAAAAVAALSRHMASKGEGCSKQPPRRPRWLAGTPGLGSSVGTSSLKKKKKREKTWRTVAADTGRQTTTQRTVPSSSLRDDGTNGCAPSRPVLCAGCVAPLVDAARPVAADERGRVPAQRRTATSRNTQQHLGEGPPSPARRGQHHDAPPVTGSRLAKKKKKRPTRRRNDTTAGAQQRRSIQGGCPAHKTKRIEKLQETHNGRHGPRPRKEAHRHAQHKNAQAAHRSRGRLPTQADTPRGAARDT